MRKVILTTMLGAALFSQYAVTAQAEVSSLRGSNNLDALAKAVVKKKQKKMEGGFDRAWKLQPPSIPHSIEKEHISLKGNTCLRCHSKANHEKEKAPEIGKSHYIARDGSRLNKPSSRRYFCNQCHAPLVDAAPLVENTF